MLDIGWYTGYVGTPFCGGVVELVIVLRHKLHNKADRAYPERIDSRTVVCVPLRMALCYASSRRSTLSRTVTPAC